MTADSAGAHRAAHRGRHARRAYVAGRQHGAAGHAAVHRQRVMFFAGLFGAYFNTRATALGLASRGRRAASRTSSSRAIIPVIATTILVLSSFTMQWGVWRIRKGDRTGMNRALALTLIMGLHLPRHARRTTTLTLVTRATASASTAASTARSSSR